MRGAHFGDRIAVISDDSCPFLTQWLSIFLEYQLDFNYLRTRNYFRNEHLMIEKRSPSNFVIPFMVFVYFKMTVIFSDLVFDRRPTIFLPFRFLDKRLRHGIWSNFAFWIPWLLKRMFRALYVNGNQYENNVFIEWQQLLVENWSQWESLNR